METEKNQAQAAQQAAPPMKQEDVIQKEASSSLVIKSVEVSKVNLRGENEPLYFTMNLRQPVPISQESEEKVLDSIRKGIKVREKDNTGTGYNHDIELSISEDRMTVEAEMNTKELIDSDYELCFNDTLSLDNRGKKIFFSVRFPREARSDVIMHRTASDSTDDQAFWAAIRNSTHAISFEHYQRFVDRLFCKKPIIAGELQEFAEDNFGAEKAQHLNVYGPYSYTVLKLATQVFLTLRSGVHSRHHLDLNEEARRLNKSSVTIDDLKDKLRNYLVGTNDVLPYLDRIVHAMLPSRKDREEVLPYCYGILQYRFTNPSLIELIWSYWHEEGMLAQTMNAIALRFQNQRSGPNDPLAELEIDPLRPLNNMIWGFVQDKYNQLSVSRRAAEYDHQYGLRLVGRAVPELQSADSRSKFIEAFHNLLYRTAVFYREDSDTTVIADAFPLLNALKDVHLLLAEGAHNQYGDLPWTARTEMLSQQWMLARPEMREFLRGRHMVPYQEDWMGAVDAMKKLQGWTDTTISHFHELAVDGERVLLSIRFGNWSDLNLTEDHARNWARYWKPEVQRYLYGYMAVTGVDLMNEMTDTREAEIRYIQPSALLQRRLMAQTRQPAALAAAPRRQAIPAPAASGYAALPRPQQTSRVSSRVRAIKYEQGE